MTDRFLEKKITMRIAIVTVLALSPVLARSQSARLETGDPEPRVVVTVTRTTHIPPDRATLYVSVEGSGESPAEAAQRERNSSRL